MKTTIDMAREVFDIETDHRGRETFSADSYGLEDFAALVRADERDRAIRENAYVLAEREACAKVCESLPMQQEIDVRDECAAAIRARSKP
jgi:hypothetical protein